MKILIVAVDFAEIFRRRRSQNLDNFHELVSGSGTGENRLT